MKKQVKELADLIVRHRAVMITEQRAFEISESLVSKARSLGRIAERWCSEEMSDETSARVTKREERLEAEVRELCSEINVRPSFDGDPRGFAVKLHFGPDPVRQPGNTWGGCETGWGIG